MLDLFPVPFSFCLAFAPNQSASSSPLLSLPSPSVPLSPPFLTLLPPFTHLEHSLFMMNKHTSTEQYWLECVLGKTSPTKCSRAPRFCGPVTGNSEFFLFVLEFEVVHWHKGIPEGWALKKPV